MNFLICGQDDEFKDIQIDKIKSNCLTKKLESFNFEFFYAEDIHEKKSLQEAFLRLPVDSKKRIILIKEIGKLKPTIKEFLIDYLEKPFEHLVLILETKNNLHPKDNFLKQIIGNLKTIESRRSYPVSSFDLYRAIENRKPDKALVVLSEILTKSNKPYFILGGIADYFKRRFAFNDRRMHFILETLLEADIKLKTSSIQPEFILERLIVKMCLIE